MLDLFNYICIFTTLSPTKSSYCPNDYRLPQIVFFQRRIIDRSAVRKRPNLQTNSLTKTSEMFCFLIRQLGQRLRATCKINLLPRADICFLGQTEPIDPLYLSQFSLSVLPQYICPNEPVVVSSDSSSTNTENISSNTTAPRYDKGSDKISPLYVLSAFQYQSVLLSGGYEDGGEFSLVIS